MPKRRFDSKGASKGASLTRVVIRMTGGHGFAVTHFSLELRAWLSMLALLSSSSSQVFEPATARAW